ncbi:hypothetical protein QZH41_015007, partial [Actinostola sp. cb2023]
KVKRNDVGNGERADIGKDEDDDEEEEDEEDEPENIADENESEDDEDESEDDTWTDQPNNTVMVKQVEALSDFPGEQPDDLSFKKGELLTILDPREDGWWVAENSSGKRGIVPKTLIKIIDTHPTVMAPTKEQNDEASKEDNDVVGELPPSPKRSIALHNAPLFCILFKLSPRPVKIDRVFSIVVARKIPLPGTGIEVLSRQLRMSLWDWKRKQVLSNVHVVRAVQHEKDALCWTFSAKSTGEKSEVSCGWCLLKLFEDTGIPAPNKNVELLVNGGTPFEENRIELDGSISLKETPGRFQSIVRTNQQPRLLVKLMSFNKATKDIHDTLPETLLTCHQYAQFIGQYRQLAAEVLFHDGRDQFSTEIITDPVISTFPSVIRVTDVMDALKRRWDNRNKKELKRSQRRVTSVMKNFFREVYMDSAYPLIISAQLPPFLWGDTNREMERLRIILDYEAHSTLENLFSAERLHKPFNIDKITFNVVSKHSIT